MNIFNKWLSPEQMNVPSTSSSKSLNEQVGVRRLVVNDYGYEKSSATEEDDKLNEDDVEILDEKLAEEIVGASRTENRESREANQEILSEIAELSQAVTDLEKEMQLDNNSALRKNINKTLGLGRRVAEFVHNLSPEYEKDGEINYALNKLLDKMLPLHDSVMNNRQGEF